MNHPFSVTHIQYQQYSSCTVHEAGLKPVLFVLVPPEKPRIYTADDNNEVRLKLGPFKVGETIRLRCAALGGRPLPRVTWWRDHALLDDSFKRYGDFKVENELILYELKREDLHSILTCQASNNNISVPVSTSVKLDMNCKCMFKMCFFNPNCKKCFF